MIVPNRKSRSGMAEINVTPFVDVMLVLLIIFMVTAPLMQEGINVDLPKVSAKSMENTEETFILTISKKEEIYINSTKIPIDNLAEKLSAIIKTRKNKEVYVKADSGARYGFVMKVLGEVRLAGIVDVGLITLPPEKARK